MEFCLIWGIGFPLLGTVAGAALVWFFDWDCAPLRRMFCGAAAGIMGMAALPGLLMPALRQSPMALVGAVLGAGFLTVPSRLTQSRGWLVALAVVLHNIPEGMATGVSFGGWLTGQGVFAADALAVGLGIGLQNVPDGAMVSLPLLQQGLSRRSAFWTGVLSGLVEPVAALVFFWATGATVWLPVLMGFAAGAMLWVVVSELIPAMELRKGKYSGLLCCLAGLVFMLLFL